MLRRGTPADLQPSITHTSSSGGGTSSSSGLQGTHGGRKGPSRGRSSLPASGWKRVLLGMISTITWMFLSTALIVANKRIYQLGFTHPFFVTGMGQVFSALGGWALVQLGMARLRPCPPWRVWAFKLAPVVASTSATMFYGNASYLTLSVAFIQILKAFTPALTLVLCVGVGLERVTTPLVISVLLIAGGTAGAVLVESASASFNVWGFLNFMASSITEAMRVVGAEVLLGGSRYNSTEALVYIGGPTSLVLLACSAIWESPMLLHPHHPTLPLVAAHPATFLLAFLLSFLVNLSCFFAIQYTSSLTFKVAGCLKNVAVVWYGVAAHGEHVTAQQVLGYAMSTAGFIMYSYLKAAPARPNPSPSLRAGLGGPAASSGLSEQQQRLAAGAGAPNASSGGAYALAAGRQGLDSTEGPRLPGSGVAAGLAGTAQGLKKRL